MAPSWSTTVPRPWNSKRVELVALSPRTWSPVIGMALGQAIIYLLAYVCLYYQFLWLCCETNVSSAFSDTACYPPPTPSSSSIMVPTHLWDGEPVAINDDLTMVCDRGMRFETDVDSMESTSICGADNQWDNPDTWPICVESNLQII